MSRAFTLEKDLTLTVLDQTKLPHVESYITINGPHDAYEAIKTMKVRGAPCIAAVACLSLLSDKKGKKLTEEELRDATKILLGSRPTAVNLKNAINHILDIIAARACVAYSEQSIDPVDKDSESSSIEAAIDESRKLNLIEEIKRACSMAIENGVKSNTEMAKIGSLEIIATVKKECVSILTHCNTGALATVHLGTAYGVIKQLQLDDKLHHLYFTETRPYLQGSRLTAWECLNDDIRATMITDSMVGHLMATKRLDAVIVGADCVASNGDTANKIGTHQIAIIAKHFGVPFFIAAPVQSFDLSMDDMKSIPIEERPAGEVTTITAPNLDPGKIARIAPPATRVWNPSFDVTPANLITSIITQYGVVKADKDSIKQFFESVADKIEFEF